jgi:hypothetical protein
MSAEDHLVVLRTYLNHLEADLLRTVLEAAGIDAFVRSDDCGGMRPHLWMGGVDLLVRAEDLPKADEVLNTAPTLWEAPPD